MIGLIGRNGGKGQSVLSCDDELPDDDDDGAFDRDVEVDEAAAEEFAECDALDDDSGAGAIDADDCSASCAELSWEQVDVAEVESCSSGSLGISSEEECISEGDSSHLSSFDDVSSSSSSSYDACLSDGSLEWGGGE